MSTTYENDEEVREAIISAFDQSTGRGDFLRTILKVGGGVAAAGVGASLLMPNPIDAASLGLSTKKNRMGVPQSDLDILNYALTLEHIEATFYAGVNAMDAPTRQVAAYVKIVAGHEKAHVDALTAAITKLGGTPVAAKK
ncbi:MAG TPA: ferritin-like domain-containing protein, partial [Chloroflexota bacterium]|nr:ferritin-like domain-containing protein [Chloroflexota bacterium]